jgi:hypothetical protein
LGTNTKSTTLRIQELAISNQTTKIDTHEENCFHYKLWGFNFCGFRASLKPQKLKSNEKQFSHRLLPVVFETMNLRTQGSLRENWC